MKPEETQRIDLDKRNDVTAVGVHYNTLLDLPRAVPHSVPATEHEHCLTHRFTSSNATRNCRGSNSLIIAHQHSQFSQSCDLIARILLCTNLGSFPVSLLTRLRRIFERRHGEKMRKNAKLQNTFFLAGSIQTLCFPPKKSSKLLAPTSSVLFF